MGSSILTGFIVLEWSGFLYKRLAITMAYGTLVLTTDYSDSGVIPRSLASHLVNCPPVSYCPFQGAVHVRIHVLLCSSFSEASPMLNDNLK